MRSVAAKRLSAVAVKLTSQDSVILHKDYGNIYKRRCAMYQEGSYKRIYKDLKKLYRRGKKGCLALVEKGFFD